MENPTPQQTPASASMASSAQKNKLMAVLAYLGVLVIVSFIFAKDDQFVKFHIKQGLVLLAIEAVVWIIRMSMIFYPLWFILHLINLAAFILAIVGIINALKGEEKQLPLVGDYAKYFKF